MRAYLLVSILLLGLTCILTSAGLTGSSFGMLDRLGVVSTGSQLLFGEPRPYRGDEWGVHTPTAVAQYTHKPSFPVVNTNTGIRGTNMLLVHMTGVPVRHVVTLVKPATWGFFFLPLRNALAWYWWLPITLGFMGFFALLQVLFARQSVLNLVLSVGFVFSMHAAAFSFWPPYVSSFAWFAGALLVLLLRSTRPKAQYLYGAGIGLALSGAFMTLYVPWIIPSLWAVVFVAGGVIVAEKLYRGWTRHTAGALLLALAIVLFFGLSWYLSVKDALQLIMSSSYPGGRVATGGDWPLWGLAKGWFSLTTFYCGALLYDGRGYNLYPYMYVPILALAAKLFVSRQSLEAPRRNQFWLLAFLCAGLACVATYQFIGIPVWLARATGFARSHGFAVEIFTGAVQTLVFGALVFVQGGAQGYTPRQSLALSGLWVLLLSVLAFSVQLHPYAEVLPSAAGMVVRGALAMLLALGLSYLFLRGRLRAFALAYCGMVLAVSLPFTPLYYAATSLTPLTPAPAEPLHHAGRSLLVNMTGQNHLWAAGEKVFNTTQYYCDMAIYDILYKNMPDADKYQKYNFMECRVGSAKSPLHYDLTYSPDGNHVLFDGELYDFSQLPIDSVIIPENSMALLEKNKSLQLESRQNGFARFRVVPGSAA